MNMLTRKGKDLMENTRFFYNDHDRLISIPSRVLRPRQRDFKIDIGMYTDKRMISRPVAPIQTFKEGKLITINSIDEHKILKVYCQKDFEDGDLYLLTSSSSDKMFYRGNFEQSGFGFSLALLLVYYDHKYEEFMVKSYLTQDVLGHVEDFLHRLDPYLSLHKFSNIYNSDLRLYDNSVIRLNWERIFVEQINTDATDNKVTSMIHTIESFIIKHISSIKYYGVSPEEKIKNILNLPRVHAYTNEQWQDFRIKIIKELFPDTKESAKIEGGLGYFLSKDLDNQYQSSSRKIAILESYIG